MQVSCLNLRYGERNKNNFDAFILNCRLDMAGKDKGSNSRKRKGGKISLFSLATYNNQKGMYNMTRK